MSTEKLSNIMTQLESIKGILDIPKNEIMSFKQNVLDDDDTYYLEIGEDLMIKNVSSNFLSFLGLASVDVINKPISLFIGYEEALSTYSKLQNKPFIKKIVELHGKKFLALVYVIDNKKSFGEYLIEIS